MAVATITAPSLCVLLLTPALPGWMFARDAVVRQTYRSQTASSVDRASTFAQYPNCKSVAPVRLGQSASLSPPVMFGMMHLDSSSLLLLYRGRALPASTFDSTGVPCPWQMDIATEVQYGGHA